MNSDNARNSIPLIAHYWWLPLVRGIVAVLLGLAMIFIPSWATSAMARYFGMFWMVTGGTALFWGTRGARATRLWLVAGLIAVVGGAILFFNEWISSSTILELTTNVFAVFAIFTGVLHIAGGYRIRQKVGRKWAWGDLFLGLLQIMMGILLLGIPSKISPVILISAVAWAFLGGLGMIVDSLRLRRMYLEHQRTMDIV
jgi:uncharacterized membrane protein HdeD (DUF308 family)